MSIVISLAGMAVGGINNLCGPYAVPHDSAEDNGRLGCLVASALQANTSVETSIEATLDRLQHEDSTNAILAIVPDALDQHVVSKVRIPTTPSTDRRLWSKQHPYQGHGHHRRILALINNVAEEDAPVVALRDAGASSWKKSLSD